MVLGEFEFDDLYKDLVVSESESKTTLIFTMILLIGLMVTGTRVRGITRSAFARHG